MPMKIKHQSRNSEFKMELIKRENGTRKKTEKIIESFASKHFRRTASFVVVVVVVFAAVFHIKIAMAKHHI